VKSFSRVFHLACIYIKNLMSCRSHDTPFSHRSFALCATLLILPYLDKIVDLFNTNPILSQIHNHAFQLFIHSSTNLPTYPCSIKFGGFLKTSQTSNVLSTSNFSSFLVSSPNPSILLSSTWLLLSFALYFPFQNPYNFLLGFLTVSGLLFFKRCNHSLIVTISNAGRVLE